MDNNDRDFGIFPPEFYDGYTLCITALYWLFTQTPVDRDAIMCSIFTCCKSSNAGFDGTLRNISTKRKHKELFVKYFARSIPSPEAIGAMATTIDRYGVLELNCHNGLWAALLRASLPLGSRVGILAPYRSSARPMLHGLIDHTDPLNDFENIKMGYSTLLIVKPLPGNETLFALKCLKTFEGANVYYVGPESGGVFDLLEELYDQRSAQIIPKWYDDSDCLFHYEPK